MIESLLTTQNVPPYIRTYNILRYFFLSNEEHRTTHIQKPVKVVVSCPRMEQVQQKG